MRWIHRWFFFKKVELARKKLFKRETVPFEKDFRRRIEYLAKMFGLQFGGKVKVSYETSKTCLSHNGRVIAEVSFYRNGVSYILVRTNVEPMPQWWLGLAFSGMKWTAARFPVWPRLTYEKPREN